MNRTHWYNGVRMRSAIEVEYARFADVSGLRWRYEHESFADGVGRWTPDFSLFDIPVTWLDEPTTVYVEVKWRHWFKEASEMEVRTVMANMQAIFASRPDAVVIVEQSGVRNRPTIVSLNDGSLVKAPGKWLTGTGGGPVLGRDLVDAPWERAWWHAEPVPVAA